MAGIYSALGELDRIRKMAGRRVKDVVKDPLGVLTQQADDLRNTQRGLDPVINAAGAGMRQIPREEQVSRMTQQALDTYAGGLGMLGHTVFHGSPRAFSKFDKAKMGTGEGNAAFGKGLYVAENPDVAKEYLNVGLKIDPGKATYGGKKIQSLYDAAQRKQDLGHRTRNQSMIDEANAELSYWEDLMVGTHPAAARERAANPDSGWPTLQKFAESIDDKKFKGVDFPDSSLYKVDIPDEVVPQMLNWDKPLKEQPAKVQKALKKLGVTQTPPAAPEAVEAAKEAYRANPSRENMQAMNALMNQGRNIMGSDIIKQGLATEEALQQAGIPGIKYLDAGSREGGGTSNMVVFSPEMMRILERNGEATGAKPWAAGEWGGRAPTEFEARHAAAQRNAALPVEQGGLGLPPNNTAMQRAYALGYTTPAYHGSGRDFTEFKNSMLGVKTGAKSAQKAHFFASNPEVSNTYVNTSHVYNDSPPVYEKLFNNPEAFDAFTKAETKDAKWAVLENNGMNYSSGQVMPVLVNQGKTRVKDYGGVGYRDATYNDELIAAKKAKKDSVELKNTYDRGPHEGSNAMTDIYAVFDPSNIRSRFAAFDPMKRHDADMLGFASPQLLGGMGLGGAGMAAYGLQDDQEGIFSRLGQYLRQRGMQ